MVAESMFNTPWIDCDVITGSPLSYLDNNMILEYILHMQLVLWSKFHWFLMTKSGFICVEMNIFAQSSSAPPLFLRNTFFRGLRTDFCKNESIRGLFYILVPDKGIGPPPG